MTGNHLTAAHNPGRRQSRATPVLSALALLAGSLAIAPVVQAADPGPDVGLGKHAVQGAGITTRVEAGSTFRYRIVVWNHGDLPATNVTVTDDLDDDLVIESTFVEVNSTKPPAAHPCDVAPGNVLTCELGTLEIENDAEGGTEDSGYVRIVVTAPEAACGTITNQAHVTTDGELPGRLVDNTSRLVSVDVHCPDVTDPTISRPVTTFLTGTRLGTTKVPLRTSWTGSDDDSGIAQFKLQHRSDGGAWKTVELSRPRAHRSVLLLAPRHTHQFRLRAEDAAGNWSPWRTGSAFGLGARQESANAISVTPSWRRLDLSGSYGGKVERTGNAGARARFAFTGRGVAWVATKSASRGSATVFVDGVEVKTVDLSRATRRTRMVVWRMNWTTVDSHVVRIVVAGTAGHPFVDVDAFAVQK
jgi:uncharacterized repeat protein (TIGR01451 family)